MELKEFISETLTHIIDGVKDAQTKIDDGRASINPRDVMSGNSKVEHGFLATKVGMATILKFDIALTVTEGTNTKGGIGVVSGFVNAGSTGASNSQNSSVSRVQFGIPLVLPTVPARKD